MKKLILILIPLLMMTIITSQAQITIVHTGNPYTSLSNWDTTYNSGASSEMIFSNTGASQGLREGCDTTSTRTTTIELSSSETQWLDVNVPSGAEYRIGRIVFMVVGNSSSTTGWDHQVWTSESVPFDVTKVKQVPFLFYGSESGNCTPFDLTMSAGVKSIRIYKRVKATDNGDGTFTLGAGTSAGCGQTMHFHYFNVYLITGPEIINFSLAGIDADAIDHIAKTIHVTVPFDTNLTSLLPTFTLAKGTTLVNPADETNPKDFSSLVTFNVTDGNKTYPYTVTVSKVAVITNYNLKQVGNKDSSMLILEGKGFTPNTKLHLVLQGDTTLQPNTIVEMSSAKLAASISFDKVPVGLYDIVVDFGDTTIVIPKGLEVEAANKVDKLKIEIIGSNRIRRGSIASYVVKITNTGNTAIKNPCIQIAINSTDSAFKVYSEIYNDVDKEIFQALGFDVREFYFTKTDDILGQNRSCKLGMFFLPEVGAYESKNLLISVKSGGDYRLSAWQSDYSIEQFAEDAINIVYTDDHVHNYLRSAQTTSTTNICDKIYTDCYNEYMSGVNQTIGEGAQEQLLDLIPIEEAKLLAKGGYDMVKLYQKMNTASETGNTTSYKEAISEQYNKSVIGSFLSLAQEVIISEVASNNAKKAITNGTVYNLIADGKASTTKGALKLVKETSLKTMAKAAAIGTLAGYLISDGAVWSLSQLRAKEMCKPSLKDCSNPPSYRKDSTTTAPAPTLSVSVVNSLDPNDKYGYRSPSGSNYFSDDKANFTYVINFENKAEATAPAQEVVIIDTLDASKFDIKSFRAGYIKIGSKMAQATYNTQSMEWDVDMRPNIYMRTNVKLDYDSIKGIARWYFRAIDPQTDTLPADPLVGFLPPNDSIGSGQGSVSFSINLKDSLANGASVANKASIVFDYNEPIITPTWTNTKDVIAPVSSMLHPVVATDSTATLSWQAEDNKDGSGVYLYNLYVKNPSESAYSLLLSNTSLTSLAFKYEKDKDYAFYVTATDSAANAEQKTAVPDVTLRVATGIKNAVIEQSILMKVSPNPSKEGVGVVVSFSTKDETKLQNAQLLISTLNGAQVKTIPVTAKELQVSGLGSGVYIFTLQIDNKSVVSEKVIIQ